MGLLWNRWGFLTFFLFFLFFASWVSLAWDAPLSNGQKVFDARCAVCHGIDAKGSPSMAKTLKVDPLVLDLTRPGILHKSTGELKDAVANGHYKMPKHRETLTPQQIKSVVQYLRSLQTSVASNK